MPLFLASVNTSYIIKKVLGDTKTKKRLESLGLVENQDIVVLSHTNNGCIILINNSRLALDKDIVKNIIV